MALTLHQISSSEFDALQNEWNELLTRSESNNIFLRWEWMHTWWSLFNQRRDLFVWIVRDQDRLVGIAPFYIHQPYLLGRRYLKLCSDELSPDYLDLIIETGRESEVVPAIFKTLRHFSHRWDIVEWNHVRNGSPLLGSQGLSGHYGSQARVSHPCPYVKIEGPFADYYRRRLELGLNRLRLDKKQKDLFGQQNVTHLRITQQAELAAYMDKLFYLHEQRALVLQRQTTFLQPLVKIFHQRISRLFLQAGLLNLQFLMRGDDPVSTSYCFDYNQKVYFFQSGFHPAYRHWSPGGILMARMIEKAFQAGFREFDFLKGDEAYKALWANASREQMEMKLYNTTLLGSSGYATDRSVSLLRNIKATMSFGTHRMIRAFS